MLVLARHRGVGPFVRFDAYIGRVLVTTLVFARSFDGEAPYHWAIAACCWIEMDSVYL